MGHSRQNHYEALNFFIKQRAGKIINVISILTNSYQRTQKITLNKKRKCSDPGSVCSSLSILEFVLFISLQHLVAFWDTILNYKKGDLSVMLIIKGRFSLFRDAASFLTVAAVTYLKKYQSRTCSVLVVW
uniref:Uncharacterized protein n=1 Tax=Glossina palpalis gambiensis TaxID=67801 RepID=A0A1B0ATX9_9MUSC